MRVLVQRSKKSFVTIGDEVTGKITHGMVLLICFTDTDSEKTIDEMIQKILKLRIFDDKNHIMNKNIIEVEGEILSISQFSLYADTKKGNRPSYKNALNRESAIKLYDIFNQKLKQYIKVETGRFGEEMEVHITNDGPITIMLER